MNINRLSWVGFVVFSTLLIFFYGIRFLQNETFQKSTFSFNVVFNDLQGLDVSDDVKMLGKKIGRISGTKIIGQKIAVELTIDNTFAFKIPIDSEIEITQSDLMGGKFISIYPGKDNDKYILDGETIAGKNAEIVSLTQDIGDLAKRLNDTFGDNQKGQIKSTIANIQSTSTLIEEFMINNQDLITQTDKDNLHSLLENINSISNNLDSLLLEEKENIKNSIEKFNLFMEDLPSLGLKLDDISTMLQNIINNINSGDGTLSKLIKDNELHDNLNGAISDFRSLLDDVKDNPTKYMKAYFQAKKK
tara:strand:- start:1210 stop:2121 length:912 start_codon:yes stop_codon:yes gene_type:complete